MAEEKNEQVYIDDIAEEKGVTMVDVLAETNKLEEEAQAVLGGSDEKCCTYTQGAMKRQALYSCLTCCPEARSEINKSAGICLACSYRCHENHELVELYTKRNFCCDCPTKRFSKSVCVLNGKLKEPYSANTENKYNQNFQALYCTCKRPYPDPDRTEEEVMLQCALCEDWFHLTHLGLDYDVSKLADNCCEMVCNSCMDRLEFLNDYRGLALKLPVNVQHNESGELSVEEDEPDAKRMKTETKDGEKDNSCSRPKVDTKETGATFWSIDWRSALCRCSKCLEIYAEKQVEFLLDPEDSSKSYEERGMRRSQSAYEQGIEALASIGHVQQIDAISEYNHMKDKLKEYLQTFASNNKIVTEQDIFTFFERMRSEKRDRITTPNFCR